jgi:hypothetical protein
MVHKGALKFQMRTKGLIQKHSATTRNGEYLLNPLRD